MIIKPFLEKIARVGYGCIQILKQNAQNLNKGLSTLIKVT